MNEQSANNRDLTEPSLIDMPEADNDISETPKLNRISAFLRRHPETAKKVGIAISLAGVALMYAGLIDGAVIEHSQSITDVDVAGSIGVAAVGLWLLTEGTFGDVARDHSVTTESQATVQE